MLDPPRFKRTSTAQSQFDVGFRIGFALVTEEVLVLIAEIADYLAC